MGSLSRAGRTRRRPLTVSPSTTSPATSSSPIRRARPSTSTTRPPTPERTISSMRRGGTRHDPERERLDANRRDRDGAGRDLQHQSCERDCMEPDRSFNRHQSQCDEQHHRLRAPRLRQRLQDADRHELCRLGREHHHEHGARRIKFRHGPDRRQRRQRHRLDAARRSRTRAGPAARPAAPASLSSPRPTAGRSPPTPSRSPTRRSSTATILAR